MNTANELTREPELITKPNDKKYQIVLEGHNTENKEISTNPIENINELFVVNLEDRPIFFANTRKGAILGIKRYFRKHINIDSDYKSYLTKVSKNRFDITRAYKWFLISYESLYATFTIQQIKRVCINPVSEETN